MRFTLVLNPGSLQETGERAMLLWKGAVPWTSSHIILFKYDFAQHCSFVLVSH